MNAPAIAVTAVVPAAGASRRFGAMKLLADVCGEPLLQHTLRGLVDAGVPRVIVVTAPGHALSSVPLTRDQRVNIVINPEPERGMFSSVQAGLAVVEPECSVVVLPADMPFVRAETMRRLVDAHCAEGEAVVAAHAGKRGHPLIVSAGTCIRLLQQPATTNLKAALIAIGVTPHEVPVDDPGVLRDVDVPEDLRVESP